MKIFGKSLSEYVAFAKIVLAAVAIIGVLRLVLSLAGVPDATVKWISMTVVVLLGALYLGVQVSRSGFGTYRHLLPMMVLQSAVANGIAALGILVAILTGRSNIFTAPEYSPGGAGATWLHFGAHIVLGLTVIALFLWALASLAMLVAKKLGAPETKAPAGA